MMTATPNDAWLRHISGKHRIIAERSGATSYLRSKCIISPQGDASLLLTLFWHYVIKYNAIEGKYEKNHPQGGSFHLEWFAESSPENFARQNCSLQFACTKKRRLQGFGELWVLIPVARSKRTTLRKGMMFLADKLQYYSFALQ